MESLLREDWCVSVTMRAVSNISPIYYANYIKAQDLQLKFDRQYGSSERQYSYVVY